MQTISNEFVFLIIKMMQIKLWQTIFKYRQTISNEFVFLIIKMMQIKFNILLYIANSNCLIIIVILFSLLYKFNVMTPLTFTNIISHKKCLEFFIKIFIVFFLCCLAKKCQKYNICFNINIYNSLIKFVLI